MAEFKNLIIEIEDRVALLTLNQPKVLNALNQRTMEELEDFGSMALALDGPAANGDDVRDRGSG